MNNNNDSQAAVQVPEVCAHEFVPSGMISFLLQSGYTVDQVAGRLAVDEDFVKGCLSNEKPLSIEADAELLRLKDLYLREQVKATLRASPYIGITKGATFLGVSKAEYEFAYNTLIRSGEVKFTRETPDWGDAGKNKMPLRKHIVK